jgi:predicted component of type VI protein secretion system
MYPVPENFEMIDDEMVPVLRAMTGLQRLEAQNQMSLDIQRRLALHIAAENPSWNPERVRSEVAHRVSGGLI